MTHDANLQLVVTRIATEFKLVKNLIAGNDAGDLSGLPTTDKASIVASLNEITTLIQTLTEGGVQFRGAISAPADLTGTSTGNAYIDAGNGFKAGDLFKISSGGTLTLSDGPLEVGALDSFYILPATVGVPASTDIALVDSTEAVTSVAGKVGAVALDTDDVAEAGNLYFTDARVLGAALAGFTSAPGVVAAADSLLAALGKIDGNHSQLLVDLGPLDTDYVAIFEAAL